MSSTSSPTPRHPLLRFADAVDSALERLGDPDPIYMGEAEKREALLLLTRGSERLTALRMRVQGVADDVATAAGARHAGVVLAVDARRSADKVGQEQRLAEALQQRWERTGAAWREGQLNGDQAAVISNALDTLPDTVSPEMLVKAEEHLIDQAAIYGPRELKLLGQRIWEVIDPDAADEQERLALEAEERNARAATRLNLKRMGDGSTRLSGRIPDIVAARLSTLLESHTSPRRDHLSGNVRDPATGERLIAERLRGQAFCALVEHADPDKLPRHGQSATTVVITMELEKLRAEVGSGELLDGTALSPGEVRLLNAPQRKAMAIRDQQCRAEGCTVPAAWCEAHHLQPFSAGGRTNLKDGVLLCSFHHHRIHEARYRHQRHPDGSIRFHRRT